MTDAPELKPCPFCGETPDKITDATRILGVFNITHRCKVIPSFVLNARTKEGVAELWNTRADLAKPWVKALVWDACDEARVMGMAWHFYERGDGQWSVSRVTPHHSHLGLFGTPDEAKAAAQADCERWIWDALE